jgi:hypothetical protein
VSYDYHFQRVAEYLLLSAPDVVRTILYLAFTGLTSFRPAATRTERNLFGCVGIPLMRCWLFDLASAGLSHARATKTRRQA